MASDPAVREHMSLFERAKAILTRPKEAWTAIAHDGTPSGELFTRYAAPLAAIGPACIFLSGQLFGGPFSRGLFAGAYSSIASYAVSLVNLLIMSFIAARLSKRYAGEGSPRDAFKLIAYSSTAAWLAGAAVLIPSLSFLSIFGMYSFFLFYHGIGPMMKVPDVNKGRFAFLTIGAAVLLNVATSMVVQSPLWSWGGGQSWGSGGPLKVQLSSDDGEFTNRDIRNLGREIRKAIRSGEIKGVAPEQLEALLPVDIGPYHRTEIESDRRGPVGSEAKGTYERDSQEFSLKIVDLAGFGGITQLGTAFDIDHRRRDAEKSEHITVRDGKTTVEKWDSGDKDGTYATLIDKRFLVVAQGEADTVDQLKSAVASVDSTKLVALEKSTLPAPR